MAEMRKRVAAILEFLGRTQSDLYQEHNDRKRLLNERNERFNELYNNTNNDNNGGASSANSTSSNDVGNDTKYEKLFTSYTSSVENTEQLTQKLITWEQKFGQYGLDS